MPFADFSDDAIISHIFREVYIGGLQNDPNAFRPLDARINPYSG